MTMSFNGANGISFSDGTTQNTGASGFGFKNRIINGDMRIDQRYAGSSVSNPTNNQYVVDRWQINTGFTGSVGRNLGSVTPPAGFSTYLGMSVGSAGQSATNYSFRQWIEGFNSADFAYGTADAKTATLSFWVRSSLTGTFGGAIQNEAGNRSYPFGYTIAAANTWQQVSVTIPGDTTGTWVGATNGYGMQIIISYGAASARQGTAGAWAAADYRSVTGQVDLITTNGATFYITGVQFEKNSTRTDFDYRAHGHELVLCQRYYERIGIGCPCLANSSTQYWIGVTFKVPKRTTAPSSSVVSATMRVYKFGIANRDNTSAYVGGAYNNSNGVLLLIPNFSGLTANESGLLGGPVGGTEADVFAIDAEL